MGDVARQRGHTQKRIHPNVIVSKRAPKRGGTEPKGWIEQEARIEVTLGRGIGGNQA
jgi:hypothetical protein